MRTTVAGQPNGTFPTTAAGFVSNGYQTSANNGGAWGAGSKFNELQVNVGVAPEPASLTLLAVTGLTAFGIRRRRGAA